MFVVQSFYQQFKWATINDWITLQNYPILLVHGNDDKLLKWDGAKRLAEDLLKQHERNHSENPLIFEVIDECGHQIMFEKPEILSKFMLHFFDRLGVISLSDIEIDIAIEPVLITESNKSWNATVVVNEI